MGWEQRRGGLYYYRPLRVNGRPRRLYCGAGFIGRGHENLDRQLRELRVQDRAAAHQQAAAHGL